MTTTRKTVSRALLWTAGVILLAQGPWVAQPVYAGCVVLKNGEVLVGRIRDDEDTEEELIIRWPYKERTDRGEMLVPKFRVRWYDREADQPTDEYWEKHENDPIDSRWLPLLEKWRLRKKAEEEANAEIFVIDDPFRDGGQRLSPRPVETDRFRIQNPEGWSTTTDEDGITIFLSDTAGTEGYRGRIHVFSVRSAIGQTELQVKWVEEQVALLADGGEFEVREKKRLRPKSGGFDQEMLTRTVRMERPVIAIRKMFFREEHTYFFAAYAHERDYGGLELLFKMCMRSLEIFEDEKREKALQGGTPAPEGPAGGSEGSGDSGGTETGQ